MHDHRQDSALLLPDQAHVALTQDAPVKLTEAEAVEIWIARWLRVPLKALVARYGCHSRRLYEVWWGERFPDSRAKAEEVFRGRYPGLTDRTSYGYRRIPRAAARKDQMSLFS